MEKRKNISKFNVSAYIVRDITYNALLVCRLFNDATFCKKIELAENIRKIDDFDITKYSSQ